MPAWIRAIRDQLNEFSPYLVPQYRRMRLDRDLSFRMVIMRVAYVRLTPNTVLSHRLKLFAFRRSALAVSSSWSRYVMMFRALYPSEFVW